MLSLELDQLDSMKPVEEKSFWTILEKTLANDDGAAVKQHLAAGRAVTYRDPGYPGGIIREWPDGRRELIDVDQSGNVMVLRAV